ncbi:MAG: hypothetical protein HQM08_24805 [Candidatus Riflebacteria bacterium]|nr:hypothetical protein [Candidatus Riflebacteria bacterium]
MTISNVTSKQHQAITENELMKQPQNLFRNVPTKNKVLGKNGFSMVEILISLLFIALVMVGISNVNIMANKSSMDAYYEFLAVQLAQEPLEIFRAFGYDWLSNYQSHALADYPLDTWNQVLSSKAGGIQYPQEAELFQRKVSLKSISTSPVKAIRIKVQVAPRDMSRAKIWLSQSDVSMEAIVCERPK